MNNTTQSPSKGMVRQFFDKIVRLFVKVCLFYLVLGIIMFLHHRWNEIQYELVREGICTMVLDDECKIQYWNHRQFTIIVNGCSEVSVVPRTRNYYRYRDQPAKKYEIKFSNNLSAKEEFLELNNWDIGDPPLIVPCTGGCKVTPITCW